MQHLRRADLLGLDDYARARDGFRAGARAHARRRRVALGPMADLLFEDRLTVLHQVQEMLHVERIADAAGIEAELAAYNPLVPDGGNLKATLLLGFADPAERRRELARLAGIEHHVQARVHGQPAITAIADEDLPRGTPGKTSAVHFLRFEFPAAAIAALRAGAPLAFALDDARLPLRADVTDPVRGALLADFD